MSASHQLIARKDEISKSKFGEVNGDSILLFTPV